MSTIPDLPPGLGVVEPDPAPEVNLVSHQTAARSQPVEPPSLILPRLGALVFTRATREIYEVLEARWRSGRWQFLVAYRGEKPNTLWIEEFNGDWVEVQASDVAAR